MTPTSAPSNQPVLRWALHLDHSPTIEELKQWPHIVISTDDYDFPYWQFDNTIMPAIQILLQRLCGGWDWYTKWITRQEELIIAFTTDADAVAVKLVIGDTIANAAKH